MDVLDRLDQAFALTGGVVARVSPDEYRTPTPCPDWDVHALLDHMIGVVARFEATASRRMSPIEPIADRVGTDPKASFDQAAKSTLAAWSQPGALDGTCRLPMGLELPAQIAIGINLVDTLVHGWDLARAVGGDLTIDPGLAIAALEAAKRLMRDDFRGPGRAFAPAVEIGPGMAPSDELIAFCGRQP
jgi:uncharacterized protein (TIGR03086 family)